MSMKIAIVLAASVAMAMSPAFAEGSRAKTKHHRHDWVAANAVESRTLPGTQVLTPAWSFACQTPYYLSRSLPCDQPIWVYGKPCEVGLGLGRWASCDER
jgi:hypothetical protein